MRALLTALCLTLAVPCAGLAADKAVVAGSPAQSHAQAAREFTIASGMWQAILNEVSDLGAVVADSLRQDRADLRPDQAADIRAVINARFQTEQDALLEAVSGVLAAHLTAEDLQVLTTYFGSEPGRAQASMIALGREMTAEEMTDMVLALPPEQRAEVEAFGNSAAASNWLEVQPRFLAEVEEVSNRFGENLVRGAVPEIREILAR